METRTINLRDLPEDIVKRAKLYATVRGITLKDFVVEAIEQALQRSTAELSSVALFVTSGAPLSERVRPLERKTKGRKRKGQ